MTHANDLSVIQQMERYGGCFVKTLAAAWRLADPENREIIKAVWPEYWQKYGEMALPECVHETDPE